MDHGSFPFAWHVCALWLEKSATSAAAAAQQVLACMLQVHQMASQQYYTSVEGKEVHGDKVQVSGSKQTSSTLPQEILQGITKALKQCMRAQKACQQHAVATAVAGGEQEPQLQNHQQQQQQKPCRSSGLAQGDLVAKADAVQQLVWLCSTALHMGTAAIEAGEFGVALELMQAAVHFSSSIRQQAGPAFAPAARNMHLPALLAAVSLLLKHHAKVPNKAALLQLSHKLLSTAAGMVEGAEGCSRAGSLVLRLKCCLACHERAEPQLKSLLLELAEHPLTTAADMHAVALEVG